ncbi:MAG: HD-GYP domain-containing protein [Clostridiales bacterium]
MNYKKIISVIIKISIACFVLFLGMISNLTYGVMLTLILIESLIIIDLLLLYKNRCHNSLVFAENNNYYYKNLSVKEKNKMTDKSILSDGELNKYIMELGSAKEELREKNNELTKYYDEIQKGYLQTVIALSNSIEAKDSYTSGHCQRVMDISCEIAKRMKFKDSDIEELRYAAILHDIGKIGISADIINKIEKLNNNEISQIKNHPTIAYNILSGVEFLNKGLNAILEHHESFDGKGYPNGLRGKEISVFGRILCIADAFDAMTSDRPYRCAMNMEKAINEIDKCKGTQFDPEIADIFIEMIKQIVNEDDEMFIE